MIRDSKEMENTMGVSAVLVISDYYKATVLPWLSSVAQYLLSIPMVSSSLERGFSAANQTADNASAS